MYGAYGFEDKEERELKMRIHKFEDKLLRSKNYQDQAELRSIIMKYRIQLQNWSGVNKKEESINRLFLFDSR